MEHYGTKKGILEALGKKGDDTRYLDRAIRRGEVGKDGEGWYIVDPAKEEIAKLKDRIEGLEFTLGLKDGYIDKLKKDIEELKKNSVEVQNGHNDSNVENATVVDDNGLLIHLEYLYNMVGAKNMFIEEVVQQFFNKNRQSYDYDSAKEQVYKIFKYVEDPEEEGELSYIKNLLQ